MKIDKVNSFINPNFGAIRVAKTANVVNNLTTQIDLFKIYRGDRPFLQKLAEKVDYRKLAPYLAQDMQQRWQKILNYCITRAFNESNSSYVSVSKDKICGIMTYSKDNNIINLDCICSIPLSKAERVKQFKKTMFYQLFRDANDTDARGIHLDAVTDGPFELVSKYEELGFKEDKKPSKYISMFCNKHKIAEQLRELPFDIEYHETCEIKHTNLLKYLA